MTNEIEATSRKARKASLVRTGAQYRVGVVSATISITTEMRKRSLVHLLLEQALVAIAARTKTSQTAIPTYLLSRLVPFCANASRLLWRKSSFRYAIGFGAVVVVIAISNGWLASQSSPTNVD